MSAIARFFFRGGRILLAALCALWVGLFGWAAVTARSSEPHAFFSSSPAPWVIAHRGGAELRPENTLIAFEHASRLGVDVLEFDIHRSRDGALVVIHDPTVDRTTDGHGAVAELTVDELKRLDAGAHFTGPDGDRYGARIPTLDQVLERFPNARFNIEMKVDGLELSLCDALRVHHALARSLVASASRERLARFREACPSVATSAALSEVLVFWGLANLGIAGSAPAPALQIPHSAPVFWPPIRWAAQRRGMVVQVFTVNEPGAMDSALRAGAHGVMTDRPDLLLERAGRE